MSQTLTGWVDAIGHCAGSTDGAECDRDTTLTVHSVPSFWDQPGHPTYLWHLPRTPDVLKSSEGGWGSRMRPGAACTPRISISISAAHGSTTLARVSDRS